MDSNSPNVEPGKIFVGGLSWETTKEKLKAYFERFGKVDDCVIMMDPVTKKPRGFGFVTFADPACVAEVVRGDQEHYIDSKKVDPKLATVKTEMGGSTQNVVKKVFVGGISTQTTAEEVKKYFSQYGLVTDVDLKYDKATQRMRGFGFVGFQSEDVVEQVCQTHFHQLNGKTVEVKKAEPRYATASASAEAYRASMGAGMGGYNSQTNYGGYSARGGGGGYSAYPYGYGYGNQQQQQNYGYGYGAAGSYAGQNAYGQFSQAAYATGGDRGYYGAQQTGTASQQQMSYGQDSSGYGRTPYTGSDGYSSGAHSTAPYSYDNQGAAAFQQQYTDTQAAGYGRGMAQQRGVNSYQQHYGSH